MPPVASSTKPPRPLSREFPETELPAMDAKWYHLTRYDSAIVSMPDGTSAAMYQRDPARFRDLVARTVQIHERLYREWPELARRYREALPELTSVEAWERTIGIPEDEARRLVVQGFFAEIIRRIGVPEVEKRLLAAVEKELQVIVGIPGDRS